MVENGGSFWEEHNVINRHRNLKVVSSMQLRDFGLNSNFLEHVDTLEQLRMNPPNIIVAEAKRTHRVRQNFYIEDQEMRKGNQYVMGLGVYQQVHVEPNTGVKLLAPGKMKFKNFYRPYIGQDLTNKSLIVLRTGGIGDLLFIQPNLIYLKNEYPSCHITFSCGPQYQPMIRNWDCVDEIVDLPFNVDLMRRIDYHCLFEGVIERCREAKTTNAYRLFTRWMGLNLPDELLVPKQIPNEECVNKMKENLKIIGIEPNDFIIFQLRASSPVRTPDLDFWRAMINDLTDRGHKVGIIDRDGMSKKIDIFLLNVKNKDKVFNLAQFSPTLEYTVATTSLSKMVVATDSALNHIAASLGIKNYGIYGPFPGEIRLATYKTARWVDAQRHCAPCFIHTSKPCPQAISYYSPCYNNIDVKKTCDEIEEFLND